jgi:hypothetical protein
MIDNNPQLSDEEIEKVFELLGLANQEQRREILTSFYISRNRDDTPLEIRADSVTTPYTDNNA